jgi:hypothetical protein
LPANRKDENMQTPGVYFKLGKHPACPKCIESRLIREEITLSAVAEGKWFAAEPGMLCGWCDQPVAREACVPAFEGIMSVISILLNQDDPPVAPPEDDRVAKATEAVKRSKAEVIAAYKQLVAIRNRMVELGLPPDPPATD